MIAGIGPMKWIVKRTMQQFAQQDNSNVTMVNASTILSCAIKSLIAQTIPMSHFIATSMSVRKWKTINAVINA